MPAPATAMVYTDRLGPHEIENFSLTLTQGDSEDNFLLTGETIVSYTFAPDDDAAANGLTILDDGGEHVTSWDPAELNLYFWLQIDPALADSSRFTGDGLVLALRYTAVTSMGREIEMSVAVLVRQP